MALMQITLYDENSEPVKSFTRGFVPWKLLKRAVRLANSMDKAKMKEEDLDELAGLVVETFGNQFTVEQLNDGADVSEMMAVLTAIVSAASGSMAPANPTNPG